jgi:uncharacterized protein YacL
LVIFVRIVFAAIGAALGYTGALVLLSSGAMAGFIDESYLVGLFVFVGFFVGIVVGPPIVRGLKKGSKMATQVLLKTPTHELVGGVIGLVSGWVIALIISIPLLRIPYAGDYVPIILGVILGYFGLMVGLRKTDDLPDVFSRTERGHAKARAASTDASPKILDTSVIIDGRISDITKSGFLEGDLIVPGFVLEELQHIADSSDVLKRNRGRRGLDILNKIQKEPYSHVRIVEQDYGDIAEVDTKLVKLARDMGGKVVTNDYNLNKVCELQGVSVLNINELANAVKPVVLPGEELKVQVIKDGKEQGQGVGYLDDGTMIVVDGGRRFIGQTVAVLVTSVLQTAAGRMIFAKPKAMERAL